MSSRVAVLTTQTPHHAYFVRELAEAGRLAAIVEETRGVTPPYDTAHPFEAERDAWETRELLGGRDVPLDEFAPVLRVESINEPAALDTVREADADITVSFGTGLIRREFIDGCHGHLLNLHGGDPERYRGVDTHLWAIWHRDWDGLVTALHVVAPQLDTGDLVGTRRLEPAPGSPLTELRAVNTRACVELVLEAAERLDSGEALPTQPPASVGRYYSFMPAPLKQVCLERWERRP